jgi:hypothetical protein
MIPLRASARSVPCAPPTPRYDDDDDDDDDYLQ